MKKRLTLSLLYFALLIIGDKSFSITNYQIRKICKKEKKELTCIKNLQEKRTKLQEGDLIEIPVKPFNK